MAPEPTSNPETPVSRIETMRERMAETLRLEASMIHAASERLTDDCDAIVDLLASCKGRILLTGLGKTGFVARKAAATLCSTGAPAIFLHPSEAVHGDLGIVTENDVVVALSYSGQTQEILGIVGFVHRAGVPIIGITGKPDSELGQRCSVLINIQVPDEADPISLAPTNSSTAALAMCDALAVTLMHRRGFTSEQFAIFHPGGNLGRKLLLKTSEIMKSGDEIPTIDESESIKSAIVVISQKRLGAAIVTDKSNNVIGLLTDGDLRRVFEHHENPLADKISRHMTSNPTTANDQSLAAHALHVMEEKQITVLPITDEAEKLVGIVHLHDLIRAGLA